MTLSPLLWQAVAVLCFLAFAIVYFREPRRLQLDDECLIAVVADAACETVDAVEESYCEAM